MFFMKLSHQLDLDVCPHCGKAKPTLAISGNYYSTQDHAGNNQRSWANYFCTSCGGVICAFTDVVGRDPRNFPVIDYFPHIPTIDETIPEKPRQLLKQAQDSLHAPSGAIMCCASAVDIMLKIKGYKEGSLFTRIKKATDDHLITEEMSKWAHQVRLEANDERHPDDNAPLPTDDEAKLSLEFAKAFAEYLFVLPSKVSRGINESEKK